MKRLLTWERDLVNAMYSKSRFSSGRTRKRVILKNGDCNVVQGNIAKSWRRFLLDFFTTLVDAKWRWTLLIFICSFLISWVLFAFIWWLIAYANGDLEYIRLRDIDPKLIRNMTYRMCVSEVGNFASAFLYSVETQQTIGYGHRFITEQCVEAILTMCLQCLMGVFIQAFIAGIVFAKLSMPKKRAQTLLFSRNAVICHRDGVPCLMFRVGDVRKSLIIEAHVRAQIIRKKISKEGEILPFYQQELTVGADEGEDRLMFIWPTTIVHKIDRNSPLYTLSASEMLREPFELVCTLEGVIDSTGMTTQARSSYLPSEVLWGHRFVNLISFRNETDEYEVDYTLFNNTYDVHTPLCSARQLDDEKETAKNSRIGLAYYAFSKDSFQRIPSGDCPDSASNSSLNSRGPQIRSYSISNVILPDEPPEMQPTFTLGGSTISIPKSSSHTTNIQSTSINEKKNCANQSESSYICKECKCAGRILTGLNHYKLKKKKRKNKK